MRFPLEIVEEVRRVVGEDYPIVFRMNICDHVEGGIEVPEAIVMAKILEEAGRCAALFSGNVCIKGNDYPSKFHFTNEICPGCGSRESCC